MKYYIYIYDKKVDVLFGQIPTNIGKKIVDRLRSVNFLGSGVTLDRPSELTRTDKVEILSGYIEDHLDVGNINDPKTLDEPKAYFKGTVPMRWGSMNRPGWEGFVYFGGEANNTIVGLGGPMKYLIELEEEQVPITSSESASCILQILHSEQEGARDNTPDHEKYGAIREVTKEIKIDPRPVEFLAKTRDRGVLDSKHILLGSPIYVASAD